MKNITRIIAILGLAAVCSSCIDFNLTDKNYSPVYRSMGTVRPAEHNSYLVTLSDSIAFVSVKGDIKDFPFKDKYERRALISYKFVGEDDAKGAYIPEHFNDFFYKEYVEVTNIDTVMIQQPLIAGNAGNREPGNDGLELQTDPSDFPCTVVTDGYLTVYMKVSVSTDDNTAAKHTFDVLLGNNPMNPYEVEVRHNANGDTKGTRDGYALFCVPLKQLPDTNGEKVVLTLKWRDTEGETQTLDYYYTTRTDW